MKSSYLFSPPTRGSPSKSSVVGDSAGEAFLVGSSSWRLLVSTGKCSSSISSAAIKQQHDSNHGSSGSSAVAARHAASATAVAATQ